MNIIEKAMRIAAQAHAGQMRKEGNLPYLMHPAMVALKLAQHNFSDTVIAAALVHDVLEDTQFSKEQMRAELGDEVVVMVEAVSEDATLPWEEKKQKYIDTVRAASSEVKAISVADKIHNAESLLAAYAKEGPAVWQHFNRGREKKLWFEEAMLAMLQETWRHPLVDEYQVLVEQLKQLSA